MKILNVKDIPDDVYNGFKAATAAQGLTIKEVLIQLMRDYVNKTREGKEVMTNEEYFKKEEKKLTEKEEYEFARSLAKRNNDDIFFANGKEYNTKSGKELKHSK